MTTRVVVTGFGCVSPFGVGVEPFAGGLRAGRDAVGPLDLFDVSGFRSGVAARVREMARPDRVREPTWRRAGRCDRMALLAVEEALERAGRPDVSAAALCCGLSTGAMLEAEDAIYSAPEQGLSAIGPRRMIAAIVSSTTDALLRHMGSHGPVSTASTACSSAGHALGEALDLLRDGEVSIAVAGGADSLCRLTLAGFNSLGVVAPDKPRPFDAERGGMVLGEGAAFVVLETEEHARARGFAGGLELAGYGSCAEGHHIVHPQADGAGAARAMRAALADAGETADRVDHVNAHGTATEQNDVMEARAIRAVLGDRADHVPVTSTKSLIGHSLGASGALEAVACLLTLERGWVAPTAGLRTQDPACAIDVVRDAPREGTFRVVLSNSFAFGGNDVALVFRRSEAT